jgi:hypothetical protein
MFQIWRSRMGRTRADGDVFIDGIATRQEAEDRKHALQTSPYDGYYYFVVQRMAVAA